MDWSELIGKEVFCKTKSSGVCSGVVIDYNLEDKILIILDKFKEKWYISISEILRLKEEKLNSKPKSQLVTQVNNSKALHS